MIDIGDNYPIIQPIKLYTLGQSWFKKFTKSLKSRTWRLIGDYRLYVPEHEKEYFAPKGFVLNLASVPRFLWPILPPDGLLLVPSVFHDFGYAYGGLIFRHVGTGGVCDSICFVKMSRKEIDQHLAYVGKEINDIKILPIISYVFLRMFGLIAWNRHRKKNRNVFEDYPELNLYETRCL